MNVYVCEVEMASYIQNDECTVIAKNEEEVKQLLQLSEIFEENQGKITITRIDMTKSQILTVSNTGA